MSYNDVVNSFKTDNNFGDFAKVTNVRINNSYDGANDCSIQFLKDGRYVIFANFIVAKNDNDRQYTPLYTAIFQENANRFYFKDDSTLVNVGIAYNYECYNSWDGILGMIPCLCVFEKNGNNITNISNNEVLELKATVINESFTNYTIPSLNEDSRNFKTEVDNIYKITIQNKKVLMIKINEEYKVCNLTNIEIDEFIGELDTLRHLEEDLVYKFFIYNAFGPSDEVDENSINTDVEYYKEKYEHCLLLYRNAKSKIDKNILEYLGEGTRIEKGNVISDSQFSPMKIFWENQGTIYKTFPQGRGETIKDRTGFMYATKLNFGSKILSEMLTYGAFDFRNIRYNSIINSTMRLNDYKEIKKDNIDDIFYINNIGVQLPILKILEYANVGWSGEDTAFICLAQIGVYPMA